MASKPKYRIRKGLGRSWYVSGFTRETGLYVVPGTTGTRGEAIRALREIKAQTNTSPQAPDVV